MLDDGQSLSWSLDETDGRTSEVGRWNSSAGQAASVRAFDPLYVG